jgi:hypothetical protein
MRKPIMIWGAPSSVPEKNDYETAFKQSGNNFGNILIGNGVRSVLEPYPIIERGEVNSPEEATERCSHVVIPAANWLWKEFDFGFMVNFLERTQLPITMIGVGAQTNDRSRTAEIHPNTLRLMRLVSDRSASIGVRGFYTAEVLAAHGIHNTEAITCPSLYTNRLPEITIDRTRLGSISRLAVNFSRRVVRHSFKPDVMRTLENTLLSYALGKEATFIAQDEIEELALSNTGAQLPKYVTDYFDVLPSESIANFFLNHTRWFSDVAAWSAFMKTNDLSIGTRFHGNLISLINGVPSVMIVHDSRTMEMATLLSVPSIHVSSDIEKKDSAAVLQGAIENSDFSGFEKTYAQLFKRYARFLVRNGLPSNLPAVGSVY